jgi:exonuclease SbcD
MHFSDFHLGVDTHGPKDPETSLNGRILDFLDSLDALIDFAYSEDVDLVIFAGDAFHKHSPDPTLLDLFAARIVRLAGQCPVVLLVGNHDVPGNIDKSSALDIFDTLNVANVIVGMNYEVHTIQTKRGMVQVATAPFPLKSMFLEVDEIKSKDSGVLFKEAIESELHNLATQIDTDYPAILTGHFSVNLAVFGSERDMYIGNDAEVNLESLVDPAGDYVALGHIHYHQSLNAIMPELGEFAPVVYAGSLDRVDFTEEKDDKGFVYVEISDSGTTWEHVLVDARPFKTVKVVVKEEENAQKKIISKINKLDLRGAVVRLQIVIPYYQENTIERQHITEALEKAGVYYIHSISVKLSDVAHRVSRLGVDGSVASLSHLDLVKLHLESEGLSDKKVASLLDLAKDIMTEVVEK